MRGRTVKTLATAAVVAAAAAAATFATLVGTAAGVLAPAGSCEALLAAFRREAAARVDASGIPGLIGPRDGPTRVVLPQGDGDSRRAGAVTVAAVTAAGRGREGGRLGVSPYTDADGGVAASAVVDEDVAGGGGDARRPSSPTAGMDFSTTNEQVMGVAEPDLVKTDGSRVFVLRDGTLSVVTVGDNGASGAVTGTLALTGHTPAELLLDGDRLLVIGSAYGELNGSTSMSVTDSGDGVTRVPDLLASRLLDDPLTVLTVVDVADSTAPAVVATFRAHGRYVAARRVDGMVRVVLSSPAAGRLSLVYPGWVPSVAGTPPRTAVAAGRGLSAAAAKEENLRRIRESTLDDWIPSYHVTTAAGTTSSGYLFTCESTYRTPVFAGFDSLSILTFDLRKPTPSAIDGDDDEDNVDDSGSCLIPTAGLGLQANGDVVYATESALYVATTDYQADLVNAAAAAAATAINVMGNGRGGTLAQETTAAAAAAFKSSTFVTHLHQFNLTSSAATYVGSGAVAGSLLNQFALHEYGGSLFVATTDGAPWDPTRNKTSSRVSALQLDRNGSLSVIGAVTDLGVGERIFSVRYVADKAYVVTFEREDPLYIIDLADPTAPTRVGELKIPGFSSYLHPVGPGRLLGVGQNATAEGLPTAAKVTLFSVEDPAAPVELDSWVDTPAAVQEGDGDASSSPRRPGVSSSSVAWDHRAFLYWAPAATAVLPLSGYGTQRFTGVLVLRVGPDALTEVGRISHPDETAVARTWVLGGDYLWSLSLSTMVVHGLDGLAQLGQVHIGDALGGGRVPRADEEGEETPTDSPNFSEAPTFDPDVDEAPTTDPYDAKVSTFEVGFDALDGHEAAVTGTPTPLDSEQVLYMAQMMDGGDEVGAATGDTYAARAAADERSDVVSLLPQTMDGAIMVGAVPVVTATPLPQREPDVSADRRGSNGAATATPVSRRPDQTTEASDVVSLLPQTIDGGEEEREESETAARVGAPAVRAADVVSLLPQTMEGALSVGALPVVTATPPPPRETGGAPTATSPSRPSRTPSPTPARLRRPSVGV
ncbi:hypothetical protein MMPV_002421 [Pyropia vietnamensis]